MNGTALLVMTVATTSCLALAALLAAYLLQRDLPAERGRPRPRRGADGAGVRLASRRRAHRGGMDPAR